VDKINSGEQLTFPAAMILAARDWEKGTETVLTASRCVKECGADQNLRSPDGGESPIFKRVDERFNLLRRRTRCSMREANLASIKKDNSRGLHGESHAGLEEKNASARRAPSPVRLSSISVVIVEPRLPISGKRRGTG